MARVLDRQSNGNNSIYQNLLSSQYGLVKTWDLYSVTKSSRNLIQRLEKYKTLDGHTGCVNTVAWSDTGSLLLTGSDDYLLNIYDSYSFRLIHSIRSGHRANVFSAKFLPCTSDLKIVSCAGDGMLQYNEIGSDYGNNYFNCHSGTTYEVLVTPGDPNSFLSCGEDGTVRAFDLRTKTKCHCQECADDILIDARHAVTSVSVNPLLPYHLAVGCKDSYVRIFDRRTLGTSPDTRSVNRNRGWMPGLFCKFKPASLKQDSSCRVTSLKYSNDGNDVLVSYCTDYVYLFTVKDESAKIIDAAENRNGCYHNGENGYDRELSSESDVLPPVKRLRLRGDWSDTGPQARPEADEEASPENNLMQRMSELFSRWIDDAMSATLRRASTSSEEDAENVPSLITTNRTEDSSQSIQRDIEDSIEGDLNESIHRDIGESIQRDINESIQRDINESIQQDIEESIERDIEESVERDIEESIERGINESIQRDIDESIQRDIEESIERDIEESIERDIEESIERNIEESIERGINESIQRDIENSIERGIGDSIERDLNESIPAVNNEFSCESNRTMQSDDARATKTEIFHNSNDSNPHDSVATRLNDTTTSAECLSAGSSFVEQQNEGSFIATPLVENSLHTDNENLNGNWDESANENASNNEENITPQDTDNQASTSIQNTPLFDDDFRERLRLAYSAHDRSSHEQQTAASKIQTFIRMHRARQKEFERLNAVRPQHMYVPHTKSLYKGHRNARTMIKEANFWGDHFILSGSDCGRIFIWDRQTSELVMLLEGDEHVVNCVQPHPFDPILASSGIDHDIKIWAPVAQEPVKPSNTEEIIERNERMLEESRDTITVPAAFVLRMFASLGSIRRRNRQRMMDTERILDEESD